MDLKFTVFFLLAHLILYELPTQHKAPEHLTQNNKNLELEKYSLTSLNSLAL